MAVGRDNSAKTAERILADVAAAPSAPEGPCLDDARIIEYALELMNESDRARALRHLETCPACLDEVIALVEEHRYWEAHTTERDRSPSFLQAREKEPTSDGGAERPPRRGPPRRR